MDFIRFVFGSYRKMIFISFIGKVTTMLHGFYPEFLIFYNTKRVPEKRHNKGRSHIISRFRLI
jgi:hypothetical protein